MVLFSHVIFDLDGTLVDSARDLHTAVNRTLRQHQLPRVELSMVQGWIGKGAEHLMASALSAVGGFGYKVGPSLMHCFGQHYRNCLGDQSRAYPGVKQGLERLKRQNLSLSLCTNKPIRYVGPLLKSVGIEGAFSAFAGGDSFAHKKPHPQPLIELCAQQGHSVTQSIMVGDSRSDKDAAGACDMAIAMVEYGYPAGFSITQEFRGPSFSSFVSLVDWLCADERGS